MAHQKHAEFAQIFISLFFVLVIKKKRASSSASPKFRLSASETPPAGFVDERGGRKARIGEHLEVRMPPDRLVSRPAHARVVDSVVRLLARYLERDRAARPKHFAENEFSADIEVLLEFLII